MVWWVSIGLNGLLLRVQGKRMTALVQEEDGYSQ